MRCPSANLGNLEIWRWITVVSCEKYVCTQPVALFLSVCLAICPCCRKDPEDLSERGFHPMAFSLLQKEGKRAPRCLCRNIWVLLGVSCCFCLLVIWPHFSKKAQCANSFLFT